MSLQRFSADGRLRAHQTSVKEIRELLGVAERDLADAGISQLSLDRRFATAYGAALQLATIALHVAGYRTSGKGHHWVTFRVLSEVMGTDVRSRADYFDSCRSKRNVADYDRAGVISETEVEAIIEQVRAFRGEVVEWLERNHSDLRP